MMIKKCNNNAEKTLHLAKMVIIFIAFVSVPLAAIIREKHFDFQVTQPSLFPFHIVYIEVACF